MKKICYFLLKQYCRMALWYYFRSWQIAGADRIPEGPVLFVANHQNAFLDAILIVCSSSRNPWFLTRAGVFANAFAKKY